MQVLLERAHIRQARRLVELDRHALHAARRLQQLPERGGSQVHTNVAASAVPVPLSGVAAIVIVAVVKAVVRAACAATGVVHARVVVMVVEGVAAAVSPVEVWDACSIKRDRRGRKRNKEGDGWVGGSLTREEARLCGGHVYHLCCKQ